MKRFRLPLLFIALLAAGLTVAFEDPSDGGVIAATTTSVNNTTTAAPFTLAKCGVYAMQCDAAACVHAGLGSSTTSTCTMGSASYGTQVDAKQLYDIELVCTGPKQADTIAVVCVSGSCNCEAQRVVSGH